MAGPEATGPAAAPADAGAPGPTAGDSAVTGAGPEADAATGSAMSDEDARSALAEAGLAVDEGNGEDAGDSTGGTTEGSDGGSAGASASRPAGTAPGADPAGQTLFDDICAVCHGDDGTGRIGLDLTISTLSPDEVRDVLLHGRPETQMTGFAEILNEAEIDSLVAYVTSLRQRG